MMAKPIIMYLSMLTLSTTTVTDPGSASGHPITNAFDYKTHTTWRSNGTASPIIIDIDAGVASDANYIGFANTNLATLGSQLLVFRGTAFPANVVVFSGPITDDAAWAGIFTGGNYRYWRIAFGPDFIGTPFASEPEIGEMNLGQRTDLSEYAAPSLDPFLSGSQVRGSRMTGGHALPSSARHVNRGTITLGAAGVERGVGIETFLDSHAMKRLPFFFMLDSDDADFSATHFLKLTDDATAARLAVGGRWNRLSLVMDVEEAFGGTE